MDGTQLGKLDLPSGGWVEFVDLDDLTGADLHALRACIKSEDSGGETTNALLWQAVILTVKTWDVPYLADPRTPEANPAAYKRLKLRDLSALEHHVEPVLALLRPPDASIDDVSPGSPTRPGSE
jgi:hypothetical protein